MTLKDAIEQLNKKKQESNLTLDYLRGLIAILETELGNIENKIEDVKESIPVAIKGDPGEKGDSPKVGIDFPYPEKGKDSTVPGPKGDKGDNGPR